jgi:cytochrome c biogenesis protein CcmG/thiol:disulfide interchange protein DsbE
MKKVLKSLSLNRIIFAGLLVFLIYRRGPEIVKNINLEQQDFPSHRLLSTQNTPVSFPPADGRKSAAVFWTTWCGPCKLEMEIIKRSIAKNNIPPERVFAIHIEGTADQVGAHMQKFGFTFPALVDADGSLAHALGVSMTPTIFLISGKGKIEWASSGVGPTDVFRIEKFLTDLD